MLSLRYPIILRGDNIFKGNLGGAITLLQARLDIAGQILFEGNVASNGGGIEMLDYSTVSSMHVCNFCVCVCVLLLYIYSPTLL